MKNLKYPHLTPVFLLHTIHLEFSTRLNKFKSLFCNGNSVLKAARGFKDFLCRNNYQFYFQKDNNYVFKG